MEAETGWFCTECTERRPEAEHLTPATLLPSSCSGCGGVFEGKEMTKLRGDLNVKRPGFEEIYMRFALDLSRRSTCRRLSVGCVITSDDYTRVYAVGYNGNVPGGKNDCDVVGVEAVGACGCLHAEENAIINCDVDKRAPKVVFSTHSPCLLCAKRLIRLGGVQRVYYGTAYRKTDALVLLREHHIEPHELGAT